MKKMPVKKQGKPSGKIDTIEKLATLVAQGFADMREHFDARFDMLKQCPRIEKHLHIS